MPKLHKSLLSYVALIAMLWLPGCTSGPTPTVTPQATLKATQSKTATSQAEPTATQPPGTAAPGNIVVTTQADERNTDGDCSLREALLAANQDAPVDACPAGQGPDVITLPPGDYVLSLSGDEDDATAGDLDVATPLTIQGAGPDQTKIDGAGLSRLFHVLPEGNLTLKGVSLNGGQPGRGKEGGGGGGIFNQGTLTLVDCTLNHNTATRRGGGLYNTGTASLTRCTLSENHDIGGGGGGISNFGHLTLSDCTITGNSSEKHGGGISNNGGQLDVIGGSIQDNRAGGHGGGIRNRNRGQISLRNVTLSGNSAGDRGGGISNFGPLTIIDSSMMNNQARNHGGGLENGADVELTDVIISENVADNDANGIGDGGGIYNLKEGTILAQGGVLDGNHDNSPGGGSGPDCAGEGFSLQDVKTDPLGGCEP